MRTSTIASMNGNGGFARVHVMAAFHSPAGLSSPATSLANGWLPFADTTVACTDHKTRTTTRRLGEGSP